MLTFWVASDEVDYALIYFWPPEVLLDELDSLVLPHVPSGFGVMFGFEDSLYESLPNPEHTLPVEQLFRFPLCSWPIGPSAAPQGERLPVPPLPGLFGRPGLPVLPS